MPTNINLQTDHTSRRCIRLVQIVFVEQKLSEFSGLAYSPRYWTYVSPSARFSAHSTLATLSIPSLAPYSRPCLSNCLCLRKELNLLNSFVKITTVLPLTLPRQKADSNIESLSNRLSLLAAPVGVEPTFSCASELNLF